ncbi:MAG: DUF4215 domain-containing protein, partial [Proteobacteria bacterium]|nr:DUF4215 domain-containing protein [Pseudomonadota bacterium]
MFRYLATCGVLFLVLTAPVLFSGGCSGSQSTDCPDGLICPPGTQCAANQLTCIEGDCGNGFQERDEGCDDGNVLPGDGCSSICQKEECGNGTVDPNEQCDPPGNGCSDACKFERCGNGTIDPEEECDGDSAVCIDCLLAICGNNRTDPGESCDDGNDNDLDACNNACSGSAVCGNNVVDPFEQCDDSNGNNNDDCVIIPSPDSDVTDGGVMDPSTDAGAGGFGHFLCLAARCGDGFVHDQQSGTEECDGDGEGVPGETAECDVDCTRAECSDGVVNTSAGEQCDDSNGNNNDGCLNTCQIATCGDGFVHAGTEQCDGDGAGTPGPTEQCDADCTLAVCGDGIVNQAAGEECDGDGLGLGGETEE